MPAPSSSTRTTTRHSACWPNRPSISARATAPAASTSRECAGRPRCAVLRHLHARRRHRTAGREAGSRADRHGAGGRPRPSARADAGHIRGGYQARRGGGQDRRAHGHGRRTHDRWRPGCAARTPPRRPVPDPDPQPQHDLGGLVRRHAGPQRSHAVWQGRRARAQPPRRHGGRLARLGQDVLRHPRGDDGSRDCVAFVQPRHRREPAQHDR